jgi:hypothetical protein
MYLTVCGYFGLVFEQFLMISMRQSRAAIAAHHLNIHVNRHHGTTLENSKNNVTLLTITSISGIIVAKETVAIATAVNEVSTC